MSNEYFGGGLKQTIQRVVSLGTSTVTTATYAVGKVPRKAQITDIRFYGQAAPTATALTAEVFARTTAGAAGVTLQSAATSIDFASAAAAKAGAAAALAAANAIVGEDRMLEVTVTADTASAGPGDLVVCIEFKPAF